MIFDIFPIAKRIGFDKKKSKMSATNVQDAIDEIAHKRGVATLGYDVTTGSLYVGVNVGKEYANGYAFVQIHNVGYTYESVEQITADITGTGILDIYATGRGFVQGDTVEVGYIAFKP